MAVPFFVSWPEVRRRGRRRGHLNEVIKLNSDLQRGFGIRISSLFGITIKSDRQPALSSFLELLASNSQLQFIKFCRCIVVPLALRFEIISELAYEAEDGTGSVQGKR